MQPNSQRAKIAEYLIWITMGVEILALINNFIVFRVVQNASKGIYISEPEAASIDSLATLLYGFEIVVFLTSLVTYLMWFYRAYNNQHQIFPMSSDRAWAIGAWIVPILSLFRPYNMMKEMYKNAEEYLVNKGIDTAQPRRLTMVGLWWGFWIGYNLLSNVGNNADQIQNLETLKIIYIVMMCVSGIFIALSIMAVKVIRNYNEMEVLLISDAQDGVVLKDDELLDAL